jgi:photosystem II stability/assembly factor-like uncharacterized protein
VLYSDDAGASWAQAQSPVRSDLTAVQFVDSQHGFAVGHDGVVLGTSDGGRQWSKLLDGRAINAIVLAQTERSGNADLLAEARRNKQAGPDKPLLDLYFKNAREGFVVGAYNLILHTSNGGKTWQSWFDRTDNPRLLNLYGIRSQNGVLFVAGEGGLLMRLDADAERFKALNSPYNGSFFGLLATPDGLLAYGMRGHAFLTRDQGQHWRALETGLAASITAADLGADGRILLVDQGGRVASSSDGGQSFQSFVPQPPVPAAAIVSTAQGIVVGGPRGVHESQP